MYRCGACGQYGWERLARLLEPMGRVSWLQFLTISNTGNNNKVFFEWNQELNPLKVTGYRILKPKRKNLRVTNKWSRTQWKVLQTVPEAEQRELVQLVRNDYWSYHNTCSNIGWIRYICMYIVHVFMFQFKFLNSKERKFSVFQWKYW